MGLHFPRWPCGAHWSQAGWQRFLTLPPSLLVQELVIYNRGCALQGPGAGAGAGAALARHGRGSHPIKVVEGGPELIHLLLADALGVACQDLVLHLIDGPGNGGKQLLPAHADMLGAGERSAVTHGSLCPGSRPPLSLALPDHRNGPKQSNSGKIVGVTRSRTSCLPGQRVGADSRG